MYGALLKEEVSLSEFDWISEADISKNYDFKHVFTSHFFFSAENVSAEYQDDEHNSEHCHARVKLETFQVSDYKVIDMKINL